MTAGRQPASAAGQVGLLSTTLVIKTRHLSHRKEEGEEEEDWSMGWLQLGIQLHRHCRESNKGAGFPL